MSPAPTTQSHVTLYRHKTSYTIPDAVHAEDGKTYYVEERIASGGNAVVHECVEKLTGESFAIKFQLELRDRRRERFQREVELLKSFSDSHIIEFIASGHASGIRTVRPRGSQTRYQGNSPAQPASVAESIPFVILAKASEDLAKYAKTPKQIPAATYLAQFMGLAKALTKINEKALHRDIKPENILVVGDTWAISDFGLCDLHDGGPDLSRVDERIGPVLWMSPEAFNKNLGCPDVIGETSDVFQLASVFWYATCGRHPTGIVRQTDWRGPSNLYPVIEKALLHSCEHRFKTSAEFSEALEAAIIR